MVKPNSKLRIGLVSKSVCNHTAIDGGNSIRAVEGIFISIYQSLCFYVKTLAVPGYVGIRNNEQPFLNAAFMM